MLKNILLKGIGQDLQQPTDMQQVDVQQPMQQSPMPYPMPFMGMPQGGFEQSPQRPDMFGQYNNPMMFLRRGLNG